MHLLVVAVAIATVVDATLVVAKIWTLAVAVDVPPRPLNVPTPRIWTLWLDRSAIA
jgi:hypothetical protein